MMATIMMMAMTCVTTTATAQDNSQKAQKEFCDKKQQGECKKDKACDKKGKACDKKGEPCSFEGCKDCTDCKGDCCKSGCKDCNCKDCTCKDKCKKN